MRFDQSERWQSSFYSPGMYLKAAVVFAATTATYFLARTSGVLDLLWRGGTNDNTSRSDAELSSAVIQTGGEPSLVTTAEGGYAFNLDSSDTVLPELAPVTTTSALNIVDFSERELPASELTETGLAKHRFIEASAETETEAGEVIEIDTEHYRVPSRQSRRLLQTGSDVTVINPIPDQFIEATTAYQRDLSSVFSENYKLMTAKLQNGSTLPGWLSAQYNVVVGSYIINDNAPMDTKGGAFLQIHNGIAYLGLSGYRPNGLLVLNVSDPKNIVSLGGYMYNCVAVPVIVQDGVAYQGCRSFTVWNVSNLSAVVSIGQFNLQYSDAYVVVIQGNLAYVGDNGYFEVLNVANPSSITRLNSVLFYDVRDIYLQNNRAYLADGPQVRIVDVSNPSNLILLGTYAITTPNVIANDIQVKNGVAYVVTRRGGLPPPYSATGLLQGGLLILDVSNPANI
jgi:hypothetical protein